MSDLTRLPGPIAEHLDWQRAAACTGLGTERFFHPDGERGRRLLQREQAAQAVCARCPVIAACAAHALAVREPYGVWGGMTETDREQILAGTAQPQSTPAQAS